VETQSKKILHLKELQTNFKAKREKRCGNAVSTRSAPLHPGAIPSAHPVRGELRMQRCANRVATI